MVRLHVTTLGAAGLLAAGCSVLVGESFEDNGPPPDAAARPVVADQGEGPLDGGGGDAEGWTVPCRRFQECDPSAFASECTDLDDCVAKAGADHPCSGPAFEAYLRCFATSACADLLANGCSAEWLALPGDCTGDGG